MEASDALLEVIDKRIDNYLKNAKVLCRYSGQVARVGEDGKVYVQLLGYDTIYLFPKRNYINPKVGDYVLIESKLSNLSSGIIVDVLNNGQE